MDGLQVIERIFGGDGGLRDGTLDPPREYHMLGFEAQTAFSAR